ncbi:MAG: SinI family restriction endonuclease [Sphaerochaetaceae bacterium]|jgi:hypothetical protein
MAKMRLENDPIETLKHHLGNDIEYSGINIVYPIWREVEKDQDVEHFFLKFYKGFINRPSLRISNPTKTIPDSAIDKLLKARIEQLSDFDITLIRFGHRLSMAAENIIGLILEEYIHNALIDKGWSCCWGNCIGAVDFCSKDGTLIQVKNKSNTENSSSNKIRKGTDIKKWYRLNALNGKTRWDDLNQITRCTNLLSEDKFQIFASNLIKENPSALYVNEKELASISKGLQKNRGISLE